jgi:tetratricopeptide (TPR) repeat protein
MGSLRLRVALSFMLAPGIIHAEEADAPFTVHVAADASHQSGVVPKSVFEAVAEVRKQIEKDAGRIRPADSETSAEILLEITERSSQGGKSIEGRLTVFDRLDGARLVGQGTSWSLAASNMISGITAYIEDHAKEMTAARAASAPRAAAVLLVRRGDALASAGDAERGLAAWEEALEISPKYAGALRRRGQARVARGEHEAALRDLDQAIADGPWDPYAYLARARAHTGAGHAVEARADHREIVEHIPRGTPLGLVPASEIVDRTAGELSERGAELERLRDELGEQAVEAKQREYRILTAVLAACREGDEVVCALLGQRLATGTARMAEPKRETASPTPTRRRR